jgi:hypothetical protein
MLMTASEHLLVLFSIVIGLGLAELLSSFHNLVHPATRTRWHWLPAFWAANVFVSIVFWWWMMSFFGRLQELPNFFGVVLILLGPVLLYLLATSVLPDITPGDAVDLRAFYFENRKRYFGFGAAYTLVLWIQAPLFGWDVPLAQHVWAATVLAMMLTLRRSSSMRVHAALAGVQALMTTASLATYWLTLG